MSTDRHYSQSNVSSPSLQVRYLGCCPYEQIWREMQQFTNERTSITADELWLVQHPPVFTQGQAGKPEHLLNPGDIPVVKTDRGGQVTYHGPGQLVAYPLLNLRRLNIGVRDLVSRLENSVIAVLRGLDIEASARKDAPGVYVQGRKIASLGLRVRKGCSFHGVSLNVDMDLRPFLMINPCGYSDLHMTQVKDCLEGKEFDLELLEQQFAHSIALAVGYEGIA